MMVLVRCCLRRQPFAIAFLAITIFFLVATMPYLSPLAAESAEDILDRIDSAVANDRYTLAISLIEEAKSLYPADFRFSLKAGRLYKDRELYRLARSEFLAALEIFPESPEILHELARTYGYLGDNAASVEVLEQLLSLLRVSGDQSHPGSELDRVIEDLGWMYFKTYRLKDGVRLLETALDERFDREWAHTLGTMYSGLYDFEMSRYWYERSIEDALEDSDDYFASVARYNLSLLETSFYLYPEARSQAESSLALMERSGGHLILGELSLLSWDLNDALESYRRGEAMDDTPLSRLDIAVLYQRIGALDEAMRNIRDIQSSPDESWMYSYGVDRVRFGMDVSRVLADLWKGMAEVDRLTPRAGIPNHVTALVRRLSWRARVLYQERRYRALVLGYQNELRERGNELDAFWNAYLASRGYGRVALGFLHQAEAIETGLTAKAESWYELEEGRELKRSEPLVRSLAGFSVYEKSGVEEALRELAFLDDDTALSRLYTLNPGGLRQHGLALPVQVHVAGGSRRAVLQRRIRSLLRRAGYRVDTSGRGDSPASVLTVQISDQSGFKWYWADPEGRTRVSGEYKGTDRRSGLAPLLSGALDVLYRTEIQDARR